MHWCRNLKRLGKAAGPSVSVISGRKGSPNRVPKMPSHLAEAVVIGSRSRPTIPPDAFSPRAHPNSAPAARLALVRGRRRAFNEHRIWLHPRPMKLQQALGKLPKVISSRSGRKLPCPLQHVCDLDKDRHFACESFHFSNLGLKVAILRVSCHNSIAYPSTNCSAQRLASSSFPQRISMRFRICPSSPMT